MKKSFKPKTDENKERSFTVFPELCKGCGICMEVCPQKCISLDTKKRGVYNTPTVKVDIKKCTACGLCQQRCPECAIKVEKKDKKKK